MSGSEQSIIQRLYNDRVLWAEAKPGAVIIGEACDGHFKESLSPDEARALAAEIAALADEADRK